MGQFFLGLAIIVICAVGAYVGGTMATKGWKKWRYPETEINSVIDHVDNGTESIKKHIDGLPQQKCQSLTKMVKL